MNEPDGKYIDVELTIRRAFLAAIEEFGRCCEDAQDWLRRVPEFEEAAAEVLRLGRLVWDDDAKQPR